MRKDRESCNNKRHICHEENRQGIRARRTKKKTEYVETDTREGVTHTSSPQT